MLLLMLFLPIESNKTLQVFLNSKEFYNLYELSLLVFYVTCNGFSVILIYVTAQMCRRTEEEVVPAVGLQRQTFRRVL